MFPFFEYFYSSVLTLFLFSEGVLVRFEALERA